MKNENNNKNKNQGKNKNPKENNSLPDVDDIFEDDDFPTEDDFKFSSAGDNTRIYGSEIKKAEKENSSFSQDKNVEDKFTEIYKRNIRHEPIPEELKGKKTEKNNAEEKITVDEKSDSSEIIKEKEDLKSPVEPEELIQEEKGENENAEETDLSPDDAEYKEENEEEDESEEEEEEEEAEEDEDEDEENEEDVEYEEETDREENADFEKNNNIVSSENKQVSNKPKKVKKELTPEEKEKNKRQNKNLAKTFVVLLLTAIIILIPVLYMTGTIIYYPFEKSFSGLKESRNSKYIVTLDNKNVSSFDIRNSGFAALTDDMLYYLSSSADDYSYKTISMGSPRMSTAGDYDLVYDLGNKSFELFLDKSVIYSGNTDNAIICGDVSKNGNFIIATAGEKSGAKTIECSVMGYDSSGTNIYKWITDDEYVVSAKIYKDGKTLAVATVKADDLNLSSFVHVMNFDYNTEYAKFSFSGDNVYFIKFISGSEIFIVTDKKIYVSKEKNLLSVYSFSGSVPEFVSSEDSDITAVICDTNEDKDSSELLIFNKDASKFGKAKLSGKVKAVSCSDDRTAVLYSKSYETYSKFGDIIGKGKFNTGAEDIVQAGRYNYILSVDNVYKFSAVGDVDRTEIKKAENNEDESGSVPETEQFDFVPVVPESETESFSEG